MRKPRSDASPFDRFRDDLDVWLLTENLSYDDALSRLRGVWPAGERMPSRSALARWSERRRQEIQLERIAKSAAAANEVSEAFRLNPADSFGTLLSMIGQAAFDARMSKGDALDIDTMRELGELVRLGMNVRHDEATLRLKEQDLAIKERRVVLLENQAKEATQVIGDGQLTDEQKMTRFREIFGVKV
jgi:hypothetical protein